MTRYLSTGGMYAHLALGSLLVLCATSAAAQDSSDGCEAVLRLTGRNTTDHRLELGVVKRLHSSHCSGKSSKAGANFDQASKSITEAGPIAQRFGFGVSKARVESFCKESSEYLDENRLEVDSTSSVVGAAVDAWSRCKSEATTKVALVKLASQPPLVSFTWVKRDGDPYKIKSVVYDRELATCTIPSAMTGSAPVEATESSNLEVATKELTLVCIRKAVTPKHREVAGSEFPALPIHIGIEGAPLTVTIPEVTQSKTVVLQDLLEKLEQHGVEIAALGKQSIVPSANEVQAKTSSDPNEVAFNADRTAMCPDGMVLKGLRVHYGGLCLNQCEKDGGVVKYLELKCSPLVRK